MKIIPICSGDRESCWSNRFYRFCGFDLDFGNGVYFLCFLRVVWGGGWRGWIFLWIGGIWQTVRNVDVRKWNTYYTDKKSLLLLLCSWNHEFVINISISTFDKMRRSLRLEAKRKIIEYEKKIIDKHTVEGNPWEIYFGKSRRLLRHIWLKKCLMDPCDFLKSSHWFKGWGKGISLVRELVSWRNR
jgi:hypothetical protein